VYSRSVLSFCSAILLTYHNDLAVSTFRQMGMKLIMANPEESLPFEFLSASARLDRIVARTCRSSPSSPRALYHH